MELVSRQIVEIIKLQDTGFVICQISIEPREIYYYKGQNEPHLSHRWMREDDWEAFDRAIEQLVERGFQSSQTVQLNTKPIYLNVERIDVNDVKRFDGLLGIDLKSMKLKNGLKCRIEYRNARYDHRKEPNSMELKNDQCTAKRINDDIKAKGGTNAKTSFNALETSSAQCKLQNVIEKPLANLEPNKQTSLSSNNGHCDASIAPENTGNNVEFSASLVNDVILNESKDSEHSAQHLDELDTSTKSGKHTENSPQRLNEQSSKASEALENDSNNMVLDVSMENEEVLDANNVTKDSEDSLQRLDELDTTTGIEDCNEKPAQRPNVQDYNTSSRMVDEGFNTVETDTAMVNKDMSKENNDTANTTDSTKNENALSESRDTSQCSVQGSNEPEINTKSGEHIEKTPEHTKTQDCKPSIMVDNSGNKMELDVAVDTEQTVQLHDAIAKTPFKGDRSIRTSKSPFCQQTPTIRKSPRLCGSTENEDRLNQSKGSEDSDELNINAKKEESIEKTPQHSNGQDCTAAIVVAEEINKTELTDFKDTEDTVEKTSAKRDLSKRARKRRLSHESQNQRGTPQSDCTAESEELLNESKSSGGGAECQDSIERTTAKEDDSKKVSQQQICEQSPQSIRRSARTFTRPKRYTEYSSTTSTKRPRSLDDNEPENIRRTKRKVKPLPEKLDPIDRITPEPENHETPPILKSIKTPKTCNKSLFRNVSNDWKWGSNKDRKTFNQKLHNKLEEELLQELATSSTSPEVPILTLNDMAINEIMDTLESVRSKLDELFAKLSGQGYIKCHDGIDHYLVIRLMSNDKQKLMMDKLSDLYETEESPKYGSHFINALMPEWILSIFMARYGMNREEAIEKIKTQNEASSIHLIDRQETEQCS